MAATVSKVGWRQGYASQKITNKRGDFHIYLFLKELFVRSSYGEQNERIVSILNTPTRRAPANGARVVTGNDSDYYQGSYLRS